MKKNRMITVLALVSALLLTYACSAAGNLPTDEATPEPILTEEVEEAVETEAPEATEEPEATESPVEADEVAGEICVTELETMLSNEGTTDAVYASPESEDEYILVTYQIDENEISSPKNGSDVPDDFTTYQEDTQTHEYLWKFFTDIIPASQRKDIREFIIFTDGADGVIGAVDEASTPGAWTMEIDIIDAQDLSTLATTLIHEFGHVLTLNSEQISDNTNTCGGYMAIDGCSNNDSYINAFYNAFWADIYEEWASTVEFKDGEVNEDKVEVFYEKYTDQFLTDYAPTGPEEDIAETWIYFIFQEKPTGDTVTDRKILFFYDYPELVKLRQEIRGGLCKYAQE